MGDDMNEPEKILLRTVRDAIFTNPFSPERLALDLSATGLAEHSSKDEVLGRLLEMVGGALASLRGRSDSRLSNTDRDLIRYGSLFYVYHTFCDEFDNHIASQIEAGDEPVEVPFSADMLGLFHEHGIVEQEAIHFFNLSFQLRRAFFFINQIAGESRCVTELRRALWRNIFTGDRRLYETHLWNRMEDFSTMILGGTGTGKTMAAAAIGRSGYIPFDPRLKKFSESFTRAFVAINLSQFSEHLIESELFGHKKGAFTGAIEAHRGIFSRCSPCGAIFLDEVGEVSIPVQIKLLQVLQERTFTPVGSHRRESFSGRVIAATNKPLDQSRRAGQFRDDFYYRLCSDIIEVPSLRQRMDEHPGELDTLIEIVITRIMGEAHERLAGRITAVVHETMPAGYPWPGNIRELEQCVRQILLDRRYVWQQPRAAGEEDSLIVGIQAATMTAEQLLAGYCRHLYRRLGTYEAVARQAGIDRRTAKKYILAAAGSHENNLSSL
jgi:DNA-binding NtrC family response regulator